MSRLHFPPRLIYLVTSGRTTLKTTPNHPEFLALLRLVEAAVAADVSLVQLREKALSAKVLFELAQRCVRLTSGSNTRLLVNDRYDVALAAGADGVHLTSTSIPTDVVRDKVGEKLLVGVSTHSVSEAQTAQSQGADFILFGPVYETESKKSYGDPQGVERLREVVSRVGPMPVIAIGGISVDNARECSDAGAAGIAAIGLFSDPESLGTVVEGIRNRE